MFAPLAVKITLLFGQIEGLLDARVRDGVGLTAKVFEPINIQPLTLSRPITE